VNLHSILLSLVLAACSSQQTPCADTMSKKCPCPCATGGALATGGSEGTGGSKATGGKGSSGGSKATGGKAATGGSSYSPGNLANCIAALSKDSAIKNVAAQQGVTVKSLATAECADPNILSRYP